MTNNTYKINLLNKHYANIQGTIPNIYIGRGSVFGNPYTHNPVATTKAEFQVPTREDAIAHYGKYFIERFKNDKEFRDEVFSLLRYIKSVKEVNFLCYCSPQPCHGDFLKKFILSNINNEKI